MPILPKICPMRNRNQAEEDEFDYGEITTYRFTAREGSNLSVAWNSDEHATFLDEFRHPGPVDHLYASFKVGFLETNIPVRTVRVRRTADDSKIWYQEDEPIGTWEYVEEYGRSAFLACYIDTDKGVRTRWYENIPGSTGWIRRPDVFDEL